MAFEKERKRAIFEWGSGGRGAGGGWARVLCAYGLTLLTSVGGVGLRIASAQHSILHEKQHWTKPTQWERLCMCVCLCWNVLCKCTGRTYANWCST